MHCQVSIRNVGVRILTISPYTLAPFRKAVDLLRGNLKKMSPRARAMEAAVRAARDETDRKLKDLCGAPTSPFDGEVLIDSQWDNPNYWLRTCLLRAAIGLPNGREVGVIGPYRREECGRTLTTLGIHRQVVHAEIPINRDEIRSRAKQLIEVTRCADDILNWKLPEGVPPALIYDGILKRQRLASVDVFRSDFRPLVEEALSGIARAKRLLDDHDFKLVVISHTLNFTYGTIAWLALSRKIPVILPFGLFGVLRMTHMRSPHELTNFYDRPTRAEMDSLPKVRADSMRQIGRRYLSARLGGKADDLASVYAYQRSVESIDRADLCRRFGWAPDKPIIGFYASNWYDWPHQLGMTQFRDFLDWTEESFRAAVSSSQFNWLFKPHPCEEWFGGVALKKILQRMPASPHVRVAEASWNNAAVMDCLDALVTYHGTAGIEFASKGKPVMVPDRGKYDDCGFVKVASDRADYLDMLHREWWSDMDLGVCRDRAELFAGWWFCAPSWQADFILGDDARTNELYSEIPSLLEQNRDTVRHEISLLREWYFSGHRYSHTYKMMMADAFKLTNV